MENSALQRSCNYFMKFSSLPLYVKCGVPPAFTRALSPRIDIDVYTAYTYKTEIAAMGGTILVFRSYLGNGCSDFVQTCSAAL